MCDFIFIHSKSRIASAIHDLLWIKTIIYLNEITPIEAVYVNIFSAISMQLEIFCGVENSPTAHTVLMPRSGAPPSKPTAAVFCFLQCGFFSSGLHPSFMARQAVSRRAGPPINTDFRRCLAGQSSRKLFPGAGHRC